MVIFCMLHCKTENFHQQHFPTLIVIGLSTIMSGYAAIQLKLWSNMELDIVFTRDTSYNE